MRFHYRQMSIINDWLNNYLLGSHQLSKQLKFPPVKLKHMIVDFYENQKNHNCLFSNMILKQDESGKGYLKDKVFEKKEALLRFTNLLSICNQEKKVSKDQMSSTKTKTNPSLYKINFYYVSRDSTARQ